MNPTDERTAKLRDDLSPQLSLQKALTLAATFAAVKLLIHILSALWQRHIGYGYFRDEFYYIACGRHLAWGYVDHGPLVAMQARLSETLFGHSLVGLRFLSALGGALRVALTGLLCWSLGGGRAAQALAMLMVITVPMYLGQDGYLSMNSWESAFWMPCLLALILILRGRSPGLWWTVFGISAGLGLLNKPSMAFFLVALGVGLLLTPQRKLLFTRHAAVGIVLLILIALPNLVWQIHNHWPTLEFLRNGRAQNKNTHLSPLAFFANQILVIGPWTAFVWIPGLLLSLRRPELRWIGYTFLAFVAIMLAMGAKDYYVTPIYPVLLALGGVAWQQRRHARLWVQQDRLIAYPIAWVTAIVFAAVLLPMAQPVLRPATFLWYRAALHLPSTNTENLGSGPLPQFYADRFGWQEETDKVEAILRQLSPEDRRHVGIFCSNYGEAGALEFLGHDLPTVISEHNNYWLWGTRGLDGELMILITRNTPAELSRYYYDVRIIGRMDHPLSMPHEHKNIYLARRRKVPLAPDWAESKLYI